MEAVCCTCPVITGGAVALSDRCALHGSRGAAILEARANQARAMEAWKAAKSRTARLHASEDVEFWSNKLAFLECAK